MLLTNITNAVVTTTQTTLSNVIAELRVFAGLLGKIGSEPMGMPRAKYLQRYAASHQQEGLQDTPVDRWHRLGGAILSRLMSSGRTVPISCCCCPSGCGCHS
ncbi:MAG: hypothetical protein KDA96_25585 [Planctomycetaceae bacterium]|nr:hypothetical protein [Planctomycetaceae bacterium]